MRRAKRTEVKLGNYHINIANSEEYHELKQEIFSDHLYYFETENPAPVIIDAGAHIGLAMLYFKKLFPGALVTAIEPHPVNFALLEENVWENGLTDVTCVQAALVGDSTQRVAHLYQDPVYNWLMTSSLRQGSWTGKQVEYTPLEVNCRPLSDFLQHPVDLLKMDIEGVEQTVLHEARAQLHFIREIIMEFHPGANQSLPALLQMFEEEHFTVQTTTRKHTKKQTTILIHARQE